MHQQIKEEWEKTQSERDQTTRDRDPAVQNGARLEQTRKLQETAATRDQLQSELEQMQRRKQESENSKECKVRMPIRPLMARSRPELKMEVDETPRATGRFNLNRIAQQQMSEDLETWTPPEPTPFLRDLELSRDLDLSCSLDKRRQPGQGSHESPSTLAKFSGAAIPRMLASLEKLEVWKTHTVS